MKRVYKTSSILVSLFLVFSLLPAGGLGVVLADSDKESGGRDILEILVGGSGEEYAAEELIVKFRGDREPMVVKLAGGKSVREAEAEFESRGDVEYAEPNYIARAFFVPNDPYYSLQWHMNNSIYGGIHTEPAWDLSRGAGVNVAVVDTGVAYENYRNPINGRRYYKAPDLASTCFVSGYDYVEKDAHPNDDNSHGTHVAGTIGQSTNNSTGVAGVAFESCLMPVKVLDRNGSGTYANVAAGIRFATDNGAKVINLSLGGSASSQTLLDAVAYAYGKGVTVIAATGNDGINVISYPAAYDDYVIAVGATRYDETRTSYSNYGASLDLVAPGGDLTVDQNGDGYGDGVLQNTFNPNTKNRSDFGYWFFQGTSMAAPHVAGVAALVISKGVTGPVNVRTALESTAEDLGTVGRDNTYGWGLVNAVAALNWTPVPPTPNSPPVADNQSVATNEDVALNITLTASDPDNDSLTYSIVSQSTNGILSGVAPNVTYAPNANYNGPDNFTFKANDGKVDSNIATVSITVNPVNDAPVANAQSVTTTQSAAVNITLTGSDVDNNPLSFAVVTNPANGTLSGVAPNLTYTPNPAFIGSDSFTFKVNDGLLDSNMATVTIAITKVNSPPVTNNQSVITNEDTPVAITLTATDPDGDTLSYSVVNPPLNGSLSGTAPNLTYTPQLNFFGSDSFTFKANDGKVDSNIATVSITINSVNDPPVAKAGAPQTVTDSDGNGTELVTLNGSASFDPDGTIASYEWKEGTTVLETGAIVTVPFAVGSHTITLIVVDNLGAQASDVTTITVNPKPSVPADVVNITRAQYDPGISELDVRATSSQGGTAVLTVEGFGVMKYNADKNRYQLRVQGVANPGTVTVTSSLGGTDTAIVEISD